MLRKAHGAGAPALLRAETAPADELPEGVAAPSSPTKAAERRPDGTLTTAGARVLGQAGGLAKAERVRFAARLADQLGLAEVGEELRPYLDAAVEWSAAQRTWLAETVGGGMLGPGPSSIVQSSALALAASRWAYQKGSETGDDKLIALGARLADQSRQGLLTSHELCAREAKSRPKAHPFELAKARLAAAKESTP